jgi:hypothetical protein
MSTYVERAKKIRIRLSEGVDKALVRWSDDVDDLVTDIISRIEEGFKNTRDNLLGMEHYHTSQFKEGSPLYKKTKDLAIEAVSKIKLEEIELTEAELSNIKKAYRATYKRELIIAIEHRAAQEAKKEVQRYLDAFEVENPEED